MKNQFILLLFLLLNLESKSQSNLLLDGIYSKSISYTSQNEIIIGGGNISQACLLKLDNANSVLFSKQYSGIDVFWDIKGYNNSIYAIANNNSKPVILKTDALGNVTWIKETSNSIGPYHGRLSIASDSLFVGIQTSDQVSAVCFDTLGNLNWSYSFPISLFNNYPISCDIFKSGPFIYLIHSNIYDLGVVKLDESGNLIWHKEFEFTSPMNIKLINKTILLNSNEFIINGSLTSDPFIIKIDTSGQFIFAKQISHPGYDFKFSESLVFYNNAFYQVGNHDDNLNLFPKSRFYITEFDASFNFIQQIEIGNWNNVSFFNHELIHTGNEFMFLRSYSGDSTELLRFQNLNQIICDTLHSTAVITNHPLDSITSHSISNTGPSFIATTTTVTNFSIPIAQLCPMMSINVSKAINDLNIYPNPNSGQFNIELPEIKKLQT